MPGEYGPGQTLLRNVDGSINLNEPYGEISVAPGATPGQTFEAHLEADASISAAAPTPPNTFPVGQPAVLLSLPGIVLRAGSVIVRASTSIFIQNDDNTTEFGPVVQLQLWIDGVQQPFANSTLAPFWGSAALPMLLDALEIFGGVQRMFTVTAGAHTIELRWGVQGQTPAVSAGIFTASGFDHASLVVQEV